MNYYKRQERDCARILAKAKSKGINPHQRRYLDVACNASFNKFNGPKVVEKLIDNKHLWEAVTMKRHDYCTSEQDVSMGLIDLRDLPAGNTNIDEMHILTIQGKGHLLKKLVDSTFKADEVDFLDPKEIQRRMGGTADYHRVLRVWWD